MAVAEQTEYPATIAGQIERLQKAKADLKTAIEGKGVTVPSNTLLNDYAQKVNLIEQGGGGSSSSDEWLYYSATGVKVIQSGFMDTFLDCSNTSNLTVERIVSDGSSSCHYGTWWADWQISDEPFVSSYVDAWFRIKPNNMSVGDTGTLTINLLNRTCIITFKLTETFSEEQMYYQGTDIQKLEIVSAPYIVNPLNGVQIGNSSSVGTITHQYNVNTGTIVSGSLYHTFLQHGAWYGFTAEDSDWGGTTNTFPYKELYNAQNYNHDIVISITDSGLLSVSFNRSVSAVNEYPWQNLVNVGVIITLDNGATLNDYFTIFSTFSCFIKGTKISLANGETISVEDVNYNDDLLVWNFDDGKYDSAKPLWIKKAQTTTWYYKLKFSNGLELNVTGAYPEAHSLFSVEDGKFIHSNRLVGKKVYTLNGIATLDSCEEIHEEVEFYNIFTYYHLNLFTNDVLTSTSLNNIYPIKDMKFVKTQREPVFDYTKFGDDWIVGARLKEQPTDVTKYVLEHIELSK